MAIAQGSRTRLSYLTESTFGTTPAGNFQEIPYTTHGLELSKERVAGTDIVSDRQARVDRHGNKTASGDIIVDLRPDTFDDFLESLMFNTWSTGATTDDLTIGTTFKHFSIEDYAADIDQARLYTGMTVSSMSVSCRPNQMVQASFEFVGKDGTLSQTEKTVTAYSASEPFDSYQGDFYFNATPGSSITDGGTVQFTNVTSFDFTIDNNIDPAFAIGNDTTSELQYGTCTVEGTMTAFFSDATYLDAFLNEDEQSVTLTVADPESPSNTYRFWFPRLKFNSATTSVDNPQARLITLDFVGLYQSSSLSSIVIQRPGTA